MLDTVMDRRSSVDADRRSLTALDPFRAMLLEALPTILEAAYRATSVDGDVGLHLRDQQDHCWKAILQNASPDAAPPVDLSSDPEQQLPLPLLVDAHGAVLEALTRAVLTAARPRLGFGRRTSDSALDCIAALTRASFAALSEVVARQARAKEAGHKRSEQQRRRSETDQMDALEAAFQGLRKLGEGDMTIRLPALSGRFDTLPSEFNAMADALQRLLRDVSAGTHGMHAGIEMIAEAAEDLSKRTEAQAHSIEATASTINEITVTVRRTAEGAEHARAFVADAKASAERSGAVMQDAVAAMAEIERSSDQISQIIGVIDEIAFQTNLLALNAGVEAARAGESGKGFAVVASEVRALAQRSAEAAKQIKQLIEQSRGQVGTGVALVGQTGKALGTIVEQVNELDGIITTIAASAHEQAAGIAQVNQAVGETDRVTRRNAAMAQDSTATFLCLQVEAGELAHMLGHLKLGEMRPDGVAQRKDERFACRESITVLSQGRPRDFIMADCSSGGARLEGRAPGPSGAEIALVLEGMAVPARIIRAEPSAFAVQFTDLASRGLISRYLLMSRKRARQKLAA